MLFKPEPQMELRTMTRLKIIGLRTLTGALNVLTAAIRRLHAARPLP
jgi:hypothetical protein